MDTKWPCVTMRFNYELKLYSSFYVEVLIDSEVHVWYSFQIDKESSLWSPDNFRNSTRILTPEVKVCMIRNWYPVETAHELIQQSELVCGVPFTLETRLPMLIVAKLLLFWGQLCNTCKVVNPLQIWTLPTEAPFIIAYQNQPPKVWSWK